MVYKTYIDNCVNETAIDDIFGDINAFACLIEEHGDEFQYGDVIVEYDEVNDIHSFYSIR